MKFSMKCLSRPVRTLWVSGCLVLALSVLAGQLPLRAGGKKSDSEVKVTVTATKLGGDGKQVVTVNLAVNKGWHIYANPVGNEDFEAAQTVVTVAGKSAPQAVKVAYPAGQVKKDKLVGDYKIYKEQVSIQASVQRAAGDSGPLEVSVKFMACHEKGVCLQPATVKLMVP